MIRTVLISAITFLGLSLPTSAAWQDFLDPDDISMMGKLIGQHKECPEATRVSYQRMIDRAREQLRAASSDSIGDGFKVDERLFGKVWSIFQQGLSIGEADARGYARLSKSRYRMQACGAEYQDTYQFMMEKSVPEAVMDGSIFKK